MKKEIICTVCPLGCVITVEGEDGKITSIEGYRCKRGLEYATNEFIHPVRILTSTVKTDQPLHPVLAVRSSKPIPKEKQMECMKEIRKVCVSAPVMPMDIVIQNICDTGVDMIATAELK